MPLRISLPRMSSATTGQAEIGDHDLAAAVEHDVGGLQVAMENAFGVRGGESGAKLARDLDGLVLRQAADAAQQRGQVFAVDVLHGEEGLAVDFAHVVDAANVGMRNAAGDADFVAKALEQSLIAGGRFGQELERDGLAEREVVGAIDFAHASLAEQRDDAVTAGNQASGKKAAFIHQVFGECGWTR